jgi:hypothetical protein
MIRILVKNVRCADIGMMTFILIASPLSEENKQTQLLHLRQADKQFHVSTGVSGGEVASVPHCLYLIVWLASY